MGKKKNIKSSPKPKNQDSVFKEAWENMNDDMAKVMPEFLAKRLKKGRGKLWVIVVITFVELVVLGTVGKLVYDWFVTS